MHAVNHGRGLLKGIVSSSDERPTYSSVCAFSLWAPKLLSESETHWKQVEGLEEGGRARILPMPSIETHCVADYSSASSSSLASALLICSSVGRAKCSLRDATSSNFGARNALTLAS